MNYNMTLSLYSLSVRFAFRSWHIARFLAQHGSYVLNMTFDRYGCNSAGLLNKDQLNKLSVARCHFTVANITLAQEHLGKTVTKVFLLLVALFPKHKKYNEIKINDEMKK